MQVLVTGASGFIGPHLVEQLIDKKNHVRCLVRTTSNVSHLKVLNAELAYGDIMDPNSLASAVSGCDVVYHLAGLTKSVPAETMWKVNEEGVRNVAEACAKQETPPVLVVLSSLAAAGPAPRERPLTESDPAKPISKYGLSKLKGEQAAFEFASRVPISIIRAPIVFGEGDLDGLAMFRCIARSRLHMVPTLRSYRYSFIHAADLSTAMMLAAAEADRISSGESEKGIFFVAAEENPTYGDYGRMIGRAIGVKAIPLPTFPMAVRIVGAVTELYARITGQAQIMNWDKTREALAGSWACSAERLHSQVGYRPAASLENRLSQTVKWYIESGHLPR
ncbi:MAG: NAD-dependent epimerase/dehydratase family protein [Rubripirellula sp.]|nr:NAD-dependent epimerase/dehydratase family protein [Rubripirellula sp.]